MSKPLIAISLILAILAGVFHFAHIAQDFEIVLVILAVVLTDIGILMGE